MYREKMQKRIEETILNCCESMYRMAMTCVRNEMEALKLVRNSAYNAIYHAGEVKNERYIETWLYKTIIYAAMDFLREDRQDIPLEVLYDVCERGKGGDSRKIRTKKKWFTLSGREKAVIILHYFEGKRVEETAIILNANIGTTNALLYRSLKKMEIDVVEAELQNEDSGLEDMKADYRNIPIPPELKMRTAQSIKQAKAEVIRQEQQRRQFTVLRKMAATLQFFT